MNLFHVTCVRSLKQKRITVVVACCLYVVYSLNSLAFADSGNSQFWTAQFRLAGLVIHPDGGSTPKIYPRKLDENAYLLIAPGAVAGLSYHLNQHHSVKGQVALLKDCTDLWEGYFHIGYRYRYPINQRLDLGFSIGPTLIWREDWNRFQEWRDYDGYKFFNKKWKDYEYEFILYGGEIEMGYQLGDTKLIVGLTPGFITLVTFGIEKRL